MILALDNSGSHASVALVRDGSVIREISVETPRGRGAGLFTSLAEILQDAAAATLTRVVVGIGPGSYNGIRSTVAAGWGVAQARGVPLVGVSSLLGLGLGGGSYAVAGDARREQYYFAIVEGDRFAEEPILLDREGLLARTAGLGMPLFVPKPVDFLPEARVRITQAARLAEIGAGQEPAYEVPEPLYLKPAFINTPSKPNGVKD